MFRWLSRGGKATGSAQGAGAEEADRLIVDGNRAEDAGDVARACDCYRKAVAAAPAYAKAHLNLGIGLEAAGDAAGAQACYEQALAIDPASPAANYNLGKLLFTKGAHAQAELRLRKALEERPDFPDARLVYGYVRAALALERAMAHHQAGDRTQAEASYRQALEHEPRNPDAWHFLGVLAFEAGRHEQAAEYISRSLEAHGANVHAQFNLGRVRQAQGRDAEALECYRAVLAAAPDHVDARFHLAGIHIARGELAQAVAAYQRLLAAKPDHAAALCNLGTALKSLGRTAEALECYRKAVQADPQFADGHYNLAVAHRDQGRIEQAVASLRRAIELRPMMADAHFALGHALRDMERREEALACFRRALELEPDHVQARWSITMAQLPAVYAAGEDPQAARQRFAEDLAQLERWFAGERVARGALAVGTDQPFELAYQEEDNRPLLQRYGALCARLMGEWQRRAGFAAPGTRAHQPIRVGIVSAHFRSHSVWNAPLKGWFRELDQTRFALYAFDLGAGEDAQTGFAKSRAAHYERGPKDLRQWVTAIRAQAPDVLIYPEVGMDPMTVRLASQRLAPVQAAGWGHPETTGLPTIDYYLSAEDLEPQDAQAYYTERLIALPRLGSYFERLNVAPVPTAPGDADGPPLLVSPGMPLKYAPAFDWVFPEIATRLGRCRFLFFSHWNQALVDRLMRRLEAAFRARGLDFAQFATLLPWQTSAGFLGWLQRADVYLDTIGFSGFNTALHAVESGLPIVTREGRFMRGRLASGILKRLGMHDVVAPTDDAYVELAVKLVQDSAYRTSFARRMAAARDGLYEDRAPVRALEEFLISALQG